jgi:Zn-dependent protease
MEIIFWIIAFVVAITIHEASHAYAADRLGDPTPKLMGRLSLNPLVHYDPVGTTMLLVLTLMRAFGLPVIPFGWAKPVQFDPYNLKNPRRDSALISLAGPASNIIFAVGVSLLLRLSIYFWGFSAFFLSIAYPVIVLSTVLAVFNLIPIHPLDGGKIFIGLLPEKDAREADLFLNRYGMFILFMLIFPSVGGSSPISLAIGPIVNFVLSLLIPGVPTV